MSDIHAPSNPASAPAPCVDTTSGQGQPTLTDIGPGEHARPIRAPAPSRLEQPVQPQDGDHATTVGGPPRVLRVGGASERGYGHAAVLVVVALAALAMVVLVVRSFAPPRPDSKRVQAGRIGVSGHTAPSRRSARTDRHGSRSQRRPVRSRRITRPARVAAPGGVDASVCAGLCSSGPVEAGDTVPRSSGRFMGQGSPVEEGGIEFGFEE